jgi:hypothetical protein
VFLTPRRRQTRGGPKPCTSKGKTASPGALTLRIREYPRPLGRTTLSSGRLSERILSGPGKAVYGEAFVHSLIDPKLFVLTATTSKGIRRGMAGKLERVSESIRKDMTVLLGHPSEDRF